MFNLERDCADLKMAFWPQEQRESYYRNIYCAYLSVADSDTDTERRYRDYLAQLRKLWGISIVDAAIMEATVARVRAVVMEMLLEVEREHGVAPSTFLH